MQGEILSLMHDLNFWSKWKLVFLQRSVFCKNNQCVLDIVTKCQRNENQQQLPKKKKKVKMKEEEEKS